MSKKTKEVIAPQASPKVPAGTREVTQHPVQEARIIIPPPAEPVAKPKTILERGFEKDVDQMIAFQKDLKAYNLPELTHAAAKIQRALHWIQLAQNKYPTKI